MKRQSLSLAFIQYRFLWIKVFSFTFPASLMVLSLKLTRQYYLREYSVSSQPRWSHRYSYRMIKMCQICRCGSKIAAQLCSRWEALWFAASGLRYLRVKCSSSHHAPLKQPLLAKEAAQNNHLVSRLVFFLRQINPVLAQVCFFNFVDLLCLAADCFTCDLIA